MSLWKDRLQKVRNDIEDNLKNPKTQEEIQKIKQGAKQIVESAKHVSTQIVQKPEDTSVAVVVEEPAPASEKKPQKRKPKKHAEASLQTEGIWDTSQTNIPNVGNKNSGALCKVQVLHNGEVIGTWQAAAPVTLSQQNLKTIEDLVGNFAWGYEEWQDRASSTGWLVGQCSLENIVQNTNWKKTKAQSDTWSQQASESTWQSV